MIDPLRHRPARVRPRRRPVRRNDRPLGQAAAAKNSRSKKHFKVNRLAPTPRESLGAVGWDSGKRSIAGTMKRRVTACSSSSDDHIMGAQRAGRRPSPAAWLK